MADGPGGGPEISSGQGAPPKPDTGGAVGVLDKPRPESSGGSSSTPPEKKRLFRNIGAAAKKALHLGGEPTLSVPPPDHPDTLSSTAAESPDLSASSGSDVSAIEAFANESVSPAAQAETPQPQSPQPPVAEAASQESRVLTGTLATKESIATEAGGVGRAEHQLSENAAKAKARAEKRDERTARLQIDPKKKGIGRATAIAKMTIKRAPQAMQERA